jgi:predicted nuclease with TOPRIM domain
MAAELKAALQEAETLRTEKARLTERLDNRESEIERLRKQTDDLQEKLVPAKK